MFFLLFVNIKCMIRKRVKRGDLKLGRLSITHSHSIQQLKYCTTVVRYCRLKVKEMDDDTISLSSFQKGSNQQDIQRKEIPIGSNLKGPSSLEV